MAKKYWQTKKFKKLKKTWYQKLKDNGFEDIEGTCPEKQTYSDTPYLKKHYIQTAGVYARGLDSLGAHYYRMASGWVWHGEFDSEWDRWVWSRHAEGDSIREIAREVVHTEFRPCSKFPVQASIERVRDQMMNSAWYQNYECDGYMCVYSYGTNVQEF